MDTIFVISDDARQRSGRRGVLLQWEACHEDDLSVQISDSCLVRRCLKLIICGKMGTTEAGNINDIRLEC